MLVYRHAYGRRSLSSLQQGTGGRQSDAGKTITIFGATGFLGRYVVNNLGRTGWTIHIAVRGDDMEWRHLKPLCDHGKLHAHYYSAKDQDSVDACIPEGKVDVVLNLIGKQYETKHYLPWIINNTFHDTNVLAAKAVAQSARRNGVGHLVHLSSAKADLDSPSEWARTKAQGELAVQTEFPGATIVRPGTMYGAEDDFLNRIAKRCKKERVLRVVDGAQSVVRPVSVLDVAKALTFVLNRDDLFAGEHVSLLGKDEYTMKQVVEFADQILGLDKTRVFVDYDFESPLVQAYGRVCGLFANPKWTLDQMKQWGLSDRAGDSHAKSWADVGVSPLKFENKAFNVLHRYRKGGHFQELRKLEAQMRNAGPVHVNHAGPSSPQELK